MNIEDKQEVTFTCIKCIAEGKSIPFALRNLANQHGININLLEETLKDVKEQAIRTKQESSTDWSRRYDEWTEDDERDTSDNK